MVVSLSKKKLDKVKKKITQSKKKTNSNWIEIREHPKRTSAGEQGK